jgi:REP element-mobilizing transposase RayT
MAKFSPDEYRYESNAVSLLNYHPELLKIPTLWTPIYFVSTAGNICTETVKKYIERQRD